MGIVGFNFSKMKVEREKFLKGKININNNVAVVDVRKSEVSITDSQKAIEFAFEFKAVYEPNLAKIELEGDVLYVTDDKAAKSIMDQWKKEKKVAPEVMTEVLNHVLAKCNVEAILLSKEANLPPTIPMPRVGENKEQ